MTVNWHNQCCGQLFSSLCAVLFYIISIMCEHVTIIAWGEKGLGCEWRHDQRGRSLPLQLSQRSGGSDSWPWFTAAKPSSGPISMAHDYQCCCLLVELKVHEAFWRHVGSQSCCSTSCSSCSIVQCAGLLSVFVGTTHLRRPSLPTVHALIGWSCWKKADVRSDKHAWYLRSRSDFLSLWLTKITSLTPHTWEWGLSI